VPVTNPQDGADLAGRPRLDHHIRQKMKVLRFVMGIMVKVFPVHKNMVVPHDLPERPKVFQSQTLSSCCTLHEIQFV
jgi:hypothetical protein